MDHQGAGRTRRAADTRRQPPWPSMDDGTGPQRVLGPGTGPQSPTGPQHLTGPGSGAQPTLRPAGSPGAAGRTPTRGFPPAREPAESPTDSFSQWHTPTGPLPVQADTQDAYAPDDTEFSGQLPPADQGAPAGRRRGGGRTRRRPRSRIAWITVAAVIAAGAGFAGFKYLY
jgi:hypothetical protein